MKTTNNCWHNTSCFTTLHKYLNIQWRNSYFRSEKSGQLTNCKFSKKNYDICQVPYKYIS